jgi:hypothetical protein
VTGVRNSHSAQSRPSEPAESGRRSDRQAMETIVAAVERIPVVKLEPDEAETSVNVRVGARVVARLDLRHGQALVNSPADTLPKLQKAFPSSRPSANGIVFDVADPKGGSEALRSILERVRVEIFLHQARWASP